MWIRGETARGVRPDSTHTSHSSRRDECVSVCVNIASPELTSKLFTHFTRNKALCDCVCECKYKSIFAAMKYNYYYFFNSSTLKESVNLFFENRSKRKLILCDNMRLLYGQQMWFGDMNVWEHNAIWFNCKLNEKPTHSSSCYTKVQNTSRFVFRWYIIEKQFNTQNGNAAHKAQSTAHILVYIYI